MGKRASVGFITFVNRYGEADTIRDYLAAKENIDDFARQDVARNWTIPLGVEWPIIGGT